MNYCENCQVATDLPRCPCCGGKKLREARSEDYCLLIEKKAMDGEMLADILRGNGVECVTMPSGSGVRTAFAAPLENRKLFVPWHSLEQAKAYLREAADTETEKWRQYLSENADKLHIPPKLEKRSSKRARAPAGKMLQSFSVDSLRPPSASKTAVCGASATILSCFAIRTAIRLSSTAKR